MNPKQQKFVDAIKSVMPNAVFNKQGPFNTATAQLYNRSITAMYDGDDNTVEIGYDWIKEPEDPANPQQGMLRAKNIQPGTTDMMRTLKQLVLSLKQNGFRIVAPGADNKLEKFYQKSLGRMGLKYTPGDMRSFGHYEHTLSFKSFLLKRQDETVI